MNHSDAAKRRRAVKADLAAGMTAAACANKYGLSADRVRRVRRAASLPIYWDWTERDRLILADLQAGKSAQVIAVYHGVGRASVYRAAQRMGFSFGPKQRRAVIIEDLIARKMTRMEIATKHSISVGALSGIFTRHVRPRSFT